MLDKISMRLGRQSNASRGSDGMRRPSKISYLLWIGLAAFAITSSTVNSQSSGGNFSLTTSTLTTGGGGVSSNGNFGLTGSVSQAAAGEQSSNRGPYQVNSGFWVPDTDSLFMNGFDQQE